MSTRKGSRRTTRHEDDIVEEGQGDSDAFNNIRDELLRIIENNNRQMNEELTEFRENVMSSTQKTVKTSIREVLKDSIEETARLASMEAARQTAAMIIKELKKDNVPPNISASPSSAFFNPTNVVTQATVHDLLPSNVGPAVSQTSQHHEASVNSIIGTSTTRHYLKHDSFDGSGSWSQFYKQFDMIASFNRYSITEKAIILASSLRGSARAILDGLSEEESRDFVKLKAALDFSFGVEMGNQSSRNELNSRKQKPNEELATFATDVRRLVRLAYTEANPETKEKLACDVFISGIANFNVRRTIKLENSNFL